MPKVSQYNKKQIERAARIYHTNTDAGISLGCRGGTFKKLCEKYDIESPLNRKARLSND